MKKNDNIINLKFHLQQSYPKLVTNVIDNKLILKLKRKKMKIKKKKDNILIIMEQRNLTFSIINKINHLFIFYIIRCTM